MKKHKIAVCGNLMQGIESYNGQTVKTHMVTDELEKTYKNIYKIDSHNWNKNPIKLLFKSLKSAISCNHIFILPAQRGIKVFVPLFLFLRKTFSFKIHYSVIGGWLPKLCLNDARILEKLKKIDYIYVETNNMKNQMNELGFTNVEVVPNFKNIKPLCVNELVYNKEMPIKLCTFSRVMEEKGITDAINAVQSVNENGIKYSLDIYGQVDARYQEEFDVIMKNFPEYIKYKGLISPNKSVEVIKEYFALLFPTKFMTEGLPGTLIDGLFAGVPMITTNWGNSHEFIENGKTGVIYLGELKDVLTEVYDNQQEFNSMKVNCINESEKYLPENVMQIIYKNI